MDAADFTRQKTAAKTAAKTADPGVRDNKVVHYPAIRFETWLDGHGWEVYCYGESYVCGKTV